MKFKLAGMRARILAGLKRIQRWTRSATRHRSKSESDTLPVHLIGEQQQQASHQGVHLRSTSSGKTQQTKTAATETPQQQIPQQNTRRFLLPGKRDIAKAVRRLGRKTTYRKFGGAQNPEVRPACPIQPDLDCSTAPPPKRIPEIRRKKRLQGFRKHAKCAMEYLAMGVAASAGGYGVPPAFDPNVFRTFARKDSRAYPEVLTVQQLRWIAQYRRDMYALANATIVC